MTVEKFLSDFRAYLLAKGGATFMSGPITPVRLLKLQMALSAFACEHGDEPSSPPVPPPDENPGREIRDGGPRKRGD